MGPCPWQVWGAWVLVLEEFTLPGNRCPEKGSEETSSEQTVPQLTVYLPALVKGI